ncbi:hypothetical protein F2Q70_00019431 [Brassica cretica]|uniref:Hexosyltransferase n=1 Tax=Brassica cretica TaxID=69181 RepID=A0A8S9GPF5_BRACR|nr:hypothetical protein F2Q70_00019431 [Brassica cretica]
MTTKMKGGGGGGEHSSSRSSASRRWTLLLCLGSFCVGMFFTDRMWNIPESRDISRPSVTEAERLKLISEGGCNNPKYLYQKEVKRDPQALLGQVSNTHNALQTLDKTISSLEMELAAARSVQESLTNGAPVSDDMGKKKQPQGKKRRYLMVVGINTAFSSRKRRDSVRATWMLQVRARFSLCNQCYSEGKVPPSFKPEEYRFREYGSEVDNIEGDVDDESSSDGDSADSEFQVEEEEEVLPLLNLVPAPVQRERGKLLWEIWEQEDTKSIDEHKTEDGDLDQLITETTEPPPDLIMPLLRYQKEFLAWATKQEQSAAAGGILADEMGMGKTIQAIQS